MAARFTIKQHRRAVRLLSKTTVSRLQEGIIADAPALGELYRHSGDLLRALYDNDVYLSKTLSRVIITYPRTQMMNLVGMFAELPRSKEPWVMQNVVDLLNLMHDWYELLREQRRIVKADKQLDISGEFGQDEGQFKRVVELLKQINADLDYLRDVLLAGNSWFKI